MMSGNARATTSVICAAASAIALVVAGVALAVYLFIPNDTYMELIVVGVASAIAVVVGILGVWLHRLNVVVSLVATIGSVVVGSVLLVGVWGTLQAAAEGGFNNIGASLLLIVGAVALIPSIVLAGLLVVSYRNDRLHATA